VEQFEIPVRRLPVMRVEAGRFDPGDDRAAVEEPLQVMVNGEPFAVIMRSPGADRELAAGFLFSEGLIARREDLIDLRERRGPSQGEPHNVVEVEVSPVALTRFGPERRRVTTSAACGLCGRQTIESLKAVAPRVGNGWAMDATVLSVLPATLRGRQHAFDQTGGLHAAGLFSPDGTLMVVAEDVGRHNAVDKVIGRLWLAERLPLASHALVVSGRASYEIVQKAFLAGVPIVAAVGAASTLAIDLASESGITLAGFVRDGRFVVYTHPRRVVIGS
jgi:FdhD protein